MKEITAMGLMPAVLHGESRLITSGMAMKKLKSGAPKYLTGHTVSAPKISRVVILSMAEQQGRTIICPM